MTNETSAVNNDKAKKILLFVLRVILKIVVYFILISVALFILVPIIYIVLMSFNAEPSLYSDTFFPEAFSLDSYKSLLTESLYLRWYLNTIIAGLANAVLCILLVTPTAYAFSRLRFKGRKQTLMMFLILQMFPSTMVIVAYYALLNLIGLGDNITGLILIYSCASIAGSSFILKGYFDTIDRSIEEAALLDGASRLTCMFRIIIPCAMPMIGLIGIFAFSAPFGDYMVAKIILNNSENYTLALGVYTYVQSTYNASYGEFAAAALLASVPMATLYMCLQKFIFKGLGASTTR